MRAFLLLLLAWPCAADYPVWIDLSGMWKIHAGDNSEWKQLDVNDSDWALFPVPRKSAPPRGVSWLRRQFDADPSLAHRDDLVLTVGGAVDQMIVFLNGKELGRNGLGAAGYLARTRSFPVPAGLIRSGANVIAIRMFYMPGGNPVRNVLASPDAGPYLLTQRENAPLNPGSLDLARREKAGTPELFVAGVFAAMATFVFLIWMGERSQTDLVLLALMLGCAAANSAGPYLSVAADSSRVYSYPLLHWGLVPLAYLAMRAGHFRYRWLQVVLWGQAILGTALFPIRPESRPFSIQYLVAATAFISVAALSWNILRVGRERGRQRTAIALPVLVIAALLMWGLGTLLSGLSFFLGGYKLPVESVAYMVLGGAMIALTLRRIAMSRREKERLSAELEAARTVQQLLLDSPSAQTSAFACDVVYHPAQEVGGDFYWMRTGADGSLVVVVGDVSGKGLKAAMLVSVAVGVLRNEKSQAPADILAALNEALAGPAGRGFVTCCCARFEPGGRVAIANAGNPPPYCDGVELLLDPALPLGIDRGIIFSEVTFEGREFTFVSDGVPEAASARGELFGFERTRGISTCTAREIAEAARAWGQNDDITVVTVAYV